MDIGSVFLILAVFVFVILFVGRPLIERRAVTVDKPVENISGLLAERDQVVAALQELDADFQLGKIPSENYPAQRLVLLQQGADILRHIDQYQQSPASATIDERLESAVTARRQALHEGQGIGRKNGNAVPPVPDDDLEQKIALRRRAMQGKAGGFCPKCGRPVQATDRFCPKCGATLA